MTVVTRKTDLEGGLIGEHVYFVDNIVYVGVGNMRIVLWVTLRNPHGGGEEFLTISAATFNRCIVTDTSAYV